MQQGIGSKSGVGHAVRSSLSVNDDPLLYSARVGIGYLANGVLKSGKIIWFWIGSHSDYGKSLDLL
jgi:hypothetical protein